MHNELGTLETKQCTTQRTESAHNEESRPLHSGLPTNWRLIDLRNNGSGSIYTKQNGDGRGGKLEDEMCIEF